MKLKKVPAVSKQELLIYMAGKDTAATLKIITMAGFTHHGIVINTGNTKEEGAMLLLQAINEKSGAATGLLHIAVANIESIEIMEEKDAVALLSLGKISAAQEYIVSGKLETQRGFIIFAASISAASDVNTGVPEMALPADGLSLNRILKLTQIIQQVVIDVLKEADARKSWKERYNKISFSDSDVLNVTGEGPVINVHFPFSDTNAPEISPEALAAKLVSVL